MKVNVFIFDEFNALEAFGASEIFGRIPENFYVEYYSMNGGDVASNQGQRVWTERLTEKVRGEILIVPGGRGAKRLLRQDSDICQILKKVIEHSSACVMIGSGSAILAQTGVLFRRRICNCPMDENWNRMFTAGIYRQEEARWVADGKFYSAENAIAGIDMCLNILADMSDLDVADRVAKEIGYQWNAEAEDGIFK